MIVRYSQRSQRRGFTFLELIIAAGLLSLLIGMIVTIARTSLQLSQAIVEKRQQETEKAAFLSLMQRQFENLPGNAIIDLRWTDAGSHYLSTMTFQNTPITFDWGDQVYSSEAIQLTTELKRNGFLDVELKFYDEEILASTGTEFTDVDPSLEITLLEDVHRFEWQVVDGHLLEPQNDWDLRGRLPLKVLLNAVFEPQGEPILQTFWITPKENPESYIGNVIQRANQRNNVNPDDESLGDEPVGPEIDEGTDSAEGQGGPE